MAGQQHGQRGAQPAQPSLAARMNSGTFLGSYSLNGTPIKAEERLKGQLTPQQSLQGPSLLERTDSSGGGGDSGSLLARMDGGKAVEDRTGPSTAAGRGNGRNTSLRDRLARPAHVTTAAPIPTKPHSFAQNFGRQANRHPSPSPQPLMSTPAKQHIRQTDNMHAASNPPPATALADRMQGSSTSPFAHRFDARPEPPVWQKPSVARSSQRQPSASTNSPPPRPSSPPRDPRMSPPKAANTQLHPPSPSSTERSPAHPRAPKVPSIQRLPPGHVTAQTASAPPMQAGSAAAASTPGQRAAARTSEAGTPPLPSSSPINRPQSDASFASAVPQNAAPLVAVRPAPPPASHPPAAASPRPPASDPNSTPSRQPIPVRAQSDAESGTPPPRPPRSNRSAESGTPPHPPPPATSATPAARSPLKSPPASSSAAFRVPKSEPISPTSRSRPLPPPCPPPYTPPDPTAPPDTMKPSLAELQRQADEARALAQEAEREAQRRREREMEEKRKSPAEAEAAAAKRKEDEGERVRAEVEAKERARLEVEEREWCRLEAEVEERPQRQAKEGRAQHEAEETARREREANTEADRIEKERLATERKEKERKAREEARKRGEAEKKARLDAELEAQTKARQEAKRREDEREEKKPLEEERKAKEAEAKAKLDAELEAQEKEREGEMRKEKLRKEEERKAVLRAQWDAQQAERERRAVAAREEEAKKVEREQHELARLAALARKRKEEEERRKEAAEEEAKQKADEEAKKEKERQAEEAMWRKEIPPLWETWDTTTYDWTVPPDSPAMSAIVRDREQVFSKQRETGTPEIQLTSRKVIAQHMATYTHSTGGRAVYAYRIRDYESFCRSVDVPPWPLSTVMIALFCLATAPRGFALSTSNNIVTALRNSTRDCVKYWQELPGFSDLSSWPKADQALMEWKNMLNPIPDEEEESAVDTPRGGFPSAAEAAFEVEEGDEDEDEEEEEDGADEEDEDGADLDEETDADTKGRPAESGKKVRRSAPEMKKFALDCTKKYPLPDMPGMPHPGQSFANLQALLKAVAVALVPTLGVTPALTNRIIACKRRKNGCPFRISTVKRADGKVVVKGNSVYAHNHGPDQRLVADPSWRPQMRNDGVAAAVAKHDKLAANKKGKKRLSDSSELPVAKHPRRESETVKSDFSKRKITVKAAPATQDEPADPVSSTSAKDASSPPAPLDAPRTEVESIQAQHDYENMEFDNSSAGEMGRTAVKAASPAAEPAHALVKADSSTPAAQLPSRPSLPPGHSPAAPSSFRPDLEAFLFAVHPSLAPLTDPLVAAGITSHRLLALFAGMERSSRHSLYEYLRIEGDMPMLDAAAVEALDEACSMAQSSQWAVR